LITAEDFNAWKRDPRTEAVFRYLEEKRQTFLETWGVGGGNEQMQGRAMELNELVSLTYEDIAILEESDEE